MLDKSAKRQSGFSLIELVATIVLMGILGTTVSVFMAGPIRQYLEIANRTTMVGVADQALRVIKSDLRSAVPNTTRIKNGRTLEFLHFKTAQRYREGALNDPEGLHFGDQFIGNGGDQFFRVLGQFEPELYGVHNYRAIVYPLPLYEAGNMDQPVSGLNVYSAPGSWTKSVYQMVTGEQGAEIQQQLGTFFGHSMSLAGLEFIAGEQTAQHDLDEAGWLPNAAQDIVKLKYPHTFAKHSEHQRIYFSDTPITFHCDDVSGKLVKYWDYEIQEKQPVPGTANSPLGAKSAVVADGLIGCDFSFEKFRGLNHDLVNILLKLESRTGESITLAQRVHIRNDP